MWESLSCRIPPPTVAYMAEESFQVAPMSRARRMAMAAAGVVLVVLGTWLAVASLHSFGAIDVSLIVAFAAGFMVMAGRLAWFSASRAAKSAEEAKDLILGRRDLTADSRVLKTAGTAVEDAPCSEPISVSTDEPRTTADLSLRRFLDEANERSFGYHQLTQAQARRIGTASIGAMVAAISLVAVGGVAAFSRGDDVSWVVPVLAGGGAVLAGMISATFLRTYKASLTEMRFYFDEPARINRLIIANHIVDEIADTARRDEARAALANALVANTYDHGPVDFGAPAEFPGPNWSSSLRSSTASGA